MDELFEEVAEIRNNTVASNSKSIYMNSMTRFILWLSENYPTPLNVEFTAKVRELGPVNRNNVAEVLSSKEVPPIAFENFQARDFMAWIVSLRKPSGEKPGYSTYNSHRSSLFNLYRDYGKTMGANLASELSNHFRGLKRRATEGIASGDVAIKVGKDPLPFSLYKFFCLTFIRQKDRQFTFAHCFIILCWNLMCRAANVVNIKYEHLDWSEDALNVYFSHQKNDQLGDRPKDPRHIYSNPICPEICPILSIGLLWLSYSFHERSNSLFPGSNQYDRFRKILQKSASIPEITRELQRLGMDSSDLGTHSMRKGSATYCSSGSTAGPSSSAIHLRAGWAMGGVQDTYLRYEAAGDMYVGRMASGLPIDKPEFDTIGPRFYTTVEGRVTEIVKEIFPAIPARLLNIGENVLAHLVYHREFLSENLPNQHPVKQSILFTNNEMYRFLKQHIVCSLNDRLEVVPTGVPPHTHLLREMSTMVDSIHAVIPAIDSCGTRVVNDVIQVLEERAIGAGTITRDGLKEILSDELRHYFRDSDRRINPEEEVDDSNIPENNQPEQFRLYHWGGKFRRVPEDYTLPNGTALAAFQAWMLPDTERSIPALRNCTAADFFKLNDKKRFSDLCTLCGRILGNRVITDPSIRVVNDIFHEWEASNGIQTRTQRNRIRRLGQLKWTTVLNMLRRMRPT